MATEGSPDAIASVALKNFKRHAKVKIAFDPHVTVVVGASDKGKSSLLHALGCATVGQPDSTNFIRHGEDDYGIQVTFADGTVLVRRRGSKGNTFTLNGTQYVRDRGDWPPPQVTKVVRMCEQNFQWQLDGPLWFLDSAGTVAKQLNKVVDLEAIDAVLASANAVAKQAVAKHEGAVQECEAAKHAYRSLKWVPEMLAAWERLKGRKERLDLTVGRRDHIKERIATVTGLSKSRPPAQLFKDFAALSDTKKRLDDARKKAAELKTVSARIDTLTQRADAYAAVSAPFAALSALRAKGEQTARKAADLANAVERIEDLQRQVKRCQRLLEDAKAELSVVEVCPACKRPLTGLPSCVPTST